MERGGLVNVVSIKWLSPGVPMTDTEEPTPERYREAADRLRELAEQSPLPDIQADLISLAAYFDRMAAALDTRRRPGASADKS